MGQAIDAVTFADYGSPMGSGGASFSPCAGATTSAACASTALAGYGCAWSGSACAGPACSAKGTQGDCTGTTGCTWKGTSATGSCIVSTCAGLAQSACSALAGCSWQSTLGACVSKLGFVHDYGFGATTYPPSCGLDVSAESAATACRTNNTCTLSAANGVFGTGASPASGTSLPLSASGSAASGYPSDPCPTITKRLAVQVTCGTCGQPTVAANTSTDFGFVVDDTTIYYTDWSTNSVYSVPKQSDGIGAVTTLATSQGQPSSIAVNGANVYWADTTGPGIMQRVGGTVSTFATDASPEYVLISGGNLFWSDYQSTSVTVRSLAGSTSKVLDSSVIAYNVALSGTTLLYGDTGSNEVRSVPIDGSASPTVLATGTEAWDVSADATNVYWIDVSGGTLSRRAIDASSSAVTMMTGMSAPYGVHVDGESLYWTAYGDGVVRMTRPTGGAAIVTIANGSGPIGVSADSTMLYWANVNSATLSKMAKPGPLATSESAVTNGGALSFWKLEDTSGSAADAIGGRTATVNGTVTFKQSAVEAHGASISFGGGYLEVPYAAALNPAAFTVSAWISATGSTSRTIVSSRDSSGGTWRGYRLYLDSSNLLHAEVGTGAASPTSVASSSAVSGAAYVVMTYASGSLKVYVNGALKGTTSVSYAPTTTAPLRIGATSEGTAAELFAGRAQAVAVYGRALSASEIATIYTLGKE
jgi:hypothetical protein